MPASMPYQRPSARDADGSLQRALTGQDRAYDSGAPGSVLRPGRLTFPDRMEVDHDID
jgi:hypothetical protein